MNPIFIDTSPYGVLYTQEDVPRVLLIRPSVDGTYITLEGNGSVTALATFDNPGDAEAAYESATRATTLGDVISLLKRRQQGNGKETE